MFGRLHFRSVSIEINHESVSLFVCVFLLFSFRFPLTNHKLQNAQNIWISNKVSDFNFIRLIRFSFENIFLNEKSKNYKMRVHKKHENETQIQPNKIGSSEKNDELQNKNKNKNQRKWRKLK